MRFVTCFFDQLNNSMKTYKERIAKTWAELWEVQNTEKFEKLNSVQKTFHNRQFLMSKRFGDYLIKTAKSNSWGSGADYIDFSFKGDGWICFSDRKRSQWFTAREAHEFLKSRKGYVAVKK